MTAKRSTTLMSLAAAGALSLALAGCGSSNSSSTSSGSSGGSSSGSYQWGINAELSGVVSYYGLGIQQGVKAYVDQVNAAGGINGHQIKLTALDNAADASRSAANMTQLATASKVNAVFGNALSADCSAETPVAERYKVTLACLSVAQKSPYVYSLGADNPRASDAMLQAAKQVTGKSNPRAALAYINTLTTEALAKDIQAGASAAGVQIVTAQEMDIAATDVSTQVAKIVASKPDVVLISDTGPGFLSVLKGVRAAGVNAPFVWVDGTGNLPSLATSTDKNIYAMSVYQLVSPNSTGAAAQSYVKAISPTLKTVNSATLNGGEAAVAYMTASAYGAALKACGYPCSGEQLKAQLDKTTVNLAGMEPNFSYTVDNHYPYPQWYMYHVVGTKYTLTKAFPATTP